MVEGLKLAGRQGGADDVSTQALEAGPIAGRHLGGGVERKSAGGEAQRPGLNAFLGIDEAPADAQPCAFARGYGAP